MTSLSRGSLAPTTRRRALALWTVLAAQLMLAMDLMIVVVALPRIQHDLSFSAAALTWVPNAFGVAFGGLLLLGGRLGDMMGQVRAFRLGLIIFVAASLLGGPSSFPNPRRRRAALRVLSVIGRSAERMLGKRYLPPPVIGSNSANIFRTCSVSGTLWGRRIFVFSAGIVQTAASRSNSFHSAMRSSPGRGNMCGSIFRASRTAGCQSWASTARSRPARAFGSKIAARC